MIGVDIALIESAHSFLNIRENFVHSDPDLENAFLDWFSVIIGIVVALLFGFLHVFYASWRYKRAIKLLSTGETGSLA